MKPKYAVHPGPVFKKNEGGFLERQHITYVNIVKLYRVDPIDCIRWDDSDPSTFLGRKEEDYIHLFPSSSGCYNLS